LTDSAISSATAIATYGTMAAALATAIATFFLWRVTRVLATETKRMADSSAQPQVVASLFPNQWSTVHLDYIVENTGNATAFDIIVEFDPPLEINRDDPPDRPKPLETISVLKPGQKISSWIGMIAPYLDNSYRVTIKWRRSPSSSELESLSYTLNMNEMRGITHLGARNPTVQIADQIKKIREDWQRVARGNQKIGADVFSYEDRERERERLEELFAEQRSKSEGSEKDNDSS
jgi:hypothetical protein